ASGMFPVDPDTLDYDAARLSTFDDHLGEALPDGGLRSLLPQVIAAGRPAGELTERGAGLLDPTGTLRPGSPMCPPEGDAGTGNVSVGTSIFAMVVLDTPLDDVHTEIDLVATPAGPTVAMVHCNNGADELNRWVSLFKEAASVLGGDRQVAPDEAFAALLTAA